MLAKTLPLLLLGACASTAQLPTADQPQLAEMAQPYAQQLQAVGITRVISPGSGAMVRLETSYGSVYVRYPTVVEPLAFVLDIGPDRLQAKAATFDRVREVSSITPVAKYSELKYTEFEATKRIHRSRSSAGSKPLSKR